MKFGGKSLADGNFKRLAKIVAEHARKGDKIIVVISALEGVTDRLSEYSHEAKKGRMDRVLKFIQDLERKHAIPIDRSIKNEYWKNKVRKRVKEIINDLEKVLTGIVYLGELTPKSEDYVLSFGEKLSTWIAWGAIQDLGLRSEYFTGGDAGILTDSNFGEATPLLNVTKHQVKTRLEPLILKGIIPVITGYIGVTQNGAITTLGRGGSDYTATIIGASIKADEVWIWTNVDGLMSADPEIVSSAKLIPEVSYQEATEMAVFGAKVMHPKALEPAMEENIPVRVRNIFNLENSGTLIIKDTKVKPIDIVKAVTLIKDVALINISGAGMIGAPGTAAKVFNVLGNEKINILMISQSVSEANISLIIPRRFLEKAINALEIALLGDGVISEVSAENDVCVVAAVGAGMKGTPGVASRIFTAVAKKGINVRMIAQGSSELNISFVVKGSEGEEAVRAIHEEFIG